MGLLSFFKSISEPNEDDDRYKYDVGDDYEEDDREEDSEEDDLLLADEPFRDTYEMVTRMRRALDKKTAPLTLDKENRKATFKGSTGKIYETTETSCTCPDFAIQRGMFCKHIYRLAHELGAYDLEKNLPKESEKNAQIRDQAVNFYIYTLQRHWEFMNYNDINTYLKKIDALAKQKDTIVIK